MIGILRAEAGTVPRALALAGIDQAELAEHARRALAGADE
jgi:D-alanyl-D-alanine carboxypeptidase